MRFIRYDSAGSFLDRVGSFLEKNEAVNNLILGLLPMLVRAESNGELPDDTYMCSVEGSDGHLVLVILMNSRNLILYGEGDGQQRESAIQIVISDLLQSGLKVPGVIGPNDLAGRFASEWASRRKLEAVIAMNQRIYRLDKVNEIVISPGRLRLADEGDMELVADWIYRFADSIGEPMAREEAVKKAHENIRQSAMYLWDDGQPVCMAKKARPTRNGIVVSLVYTPPAFRNKGYATSCVASLSRLLLAEGYRFCSLYTDLSNPVSNRIYANIGYNPVCDSVMYRFK